MSYELDVFDGLESTPADYRSLIEASQNTTFDQTLPWFDAFAAHIVQAPDTVRVYGLRANGRPVAILPLVVKKQTIYGEALQALSNFYTAFFGPVLDTSVDPETALSELVRLLMAHTSVYRIDLNPMLLDERFELLARSFRNNGCYVEEYFRFGNWILNLEQRTYAEYHPSLPSKLRSTIKRKSASLEKLEGVEITIVTDPGNVELAMNDYETIYNLSWKHAEPFPDFIRQVAKDFAERGWLRLGLIRIGERPVAAQIWYVVNGVASIFKLAYDPEFRKTSAGSVLSARLFAHTIDEDNVTTVDYLCGDDAYKADWMNLRRECWGIRAYSRNHIAGHLLGSKMKLKRLVGSLRKKSDA